VARRVAFAACPGRGLLSAAQVDAALAADPHDFSVVDLVPLEITPQPGGDSAMPEADVAAIAGVCAGRACCSIWTARTSSMPPRSPARRWRTTQGSDALRFCLSRGQPAMVEFCAVLFGNASPQGSELPFQLFMARRRSKQAPMRIC